MQIVVAEDSVLFREGLCRLLADAGHVVTAAVGDVAALLAAVRAAPPQLCVVDVRMPSGVGTDAAATDGTADGAGAVRALREERPDLTTLLLSQHIELRHCRDLLGVPGFGYLLKDRVLAVEEFLDAVTRVGAGGSALDPLIVRTLVQQKHGRTPVATLTDREHQVLGLVAEGHSNAAVAAALILSERTVESHMRSVFAKFGMDDDAGTHRRVLAVLRYLDGR